MTRLLRDQETQRTIFQEMEKYDTPDDVWFMVAQAWWAQLLVYKSELGTDTSWEPGPIQNNQLVYAAGKTWIGHWGRSTMTCHKW